MVGKEDIIFENAPISIFETNQAFEITRVNIEVLGDFGYSTEEELIAKHIAVIIPDFPEKRILDLEGFAQNPDSRQSGKVHKFRCHGKKKNGMQFPLQLFISYAKSDNGSARVHFFMIDKTKEHETNKLLEEKNKKLQKENNEAREFKLRYSENQEQAKILITSMYMISTLLVVAMAVGVLTKNADQVINLAFNAISMLIGTVLGVMVTQYFNKKKDDDDK